ncbi:NAD(P)-dependent oxidoreductase [Dactylosporangium fulvum]|uniref:NAD(P)-dependent oxidoreductase n=1 Tax=Dactylosporangium fulvum TaxID=53359 RepID=A0ABY5W7M1_9ACTN|nr:NAD(P)-dependent oxidoreductase [Dactylosporangium fulvum]UWP86078.1 NAD(P)-dependent oxidoreductase [Dactylosporangium fulvum]
MAEIGQVAVIGMGNMGRGMVHRLLAAGYQVVVHNRTPERARPVVEAGATLAGSAAEASASAPVVLLSLSDDDAVEQVLFGEVLAALRPGASVVDTSTVSPAYTREATARVARAGARRVEVSLLGNPQQAATGELRLFTAGDPAGVAAVRPVLDALGADVRHVGESGAAATLKLAFNLVLGAQVAALAEAVTFGVRSGLDRTMLLHSIANSGFSSMVMKFRAELMAARRYDPAFFRAELMEKDLRIALDAVGEAGQTLRVLDGARRQFAAVVEAGQGDVDAAAVIEHLTGR